MDFDRKEWECFDPNDQSYFTDLDHFIGFDAQSYEDIRQYLRKLAQDDLYFLSKYILNYDKLTHYLHKPVCEWLRQHAYDFWALIYPGNHYKTTIATKS